jgi:MFS family permease
MSMQSAKVRPSLLGAFWFGSQVVWGALLGVSLQSRVTELAGASQALATFGKIAALGAAVAAITQILAGVLSDRLRTRGSRRIEFYLAGAVCAAAALFWFYEAPSIAQLFAALLVLQFAMNFAAGPYQAAIPDFVPDEEVGTASSWMAGLQSLGFACGALAAGLVGNHAIVAAVLVVPLLLCAALTAAHVRNLALLPARAQVLRVSRAFIDLFISRSFVFLGIYTLLDYLFFYVGAVLGEDGRMMTGVLLLTVTATGALGALLAARPADRLDRRGVTAAGGGIFIVAISAFLLSHALGGLLLSAVVAGVGYGIFLSGDWALGCRFLPRGSLATAMGAWNLAVLLPQMAAPALAGALISALHRFNNPAAGPRLAFALAAVETLCGVAWIWRLPASTPVGTLPSGNTP